MNAARFPSKPLTQIGEHTLLGWTILAVKACRALDQVVVATTTADTDAAICAHAAAYGVQSLRGNEEDVLDRYIQCARAFDADVIVRVSGDSPLWSAWVGDYVTRQYLMRRVDYASNCIRDVFPLGVQVEVFSRQALEASVALADLATDHEHVTPALRRHYPRFSAFSVLAPPELHRPQYRLCVDTEEDHAVVSELFHRVSHGPDLPPDLLALCRELDGDPDLRSRNERVVQKYKTGRDIGVEVPSTVMPLSCQR